MRHAALPAVIALALASCTGIAPAAALEPTAGAYASAPDATVPVLVYRRLAMSDDMRGRYDLDEAFLPDDRIAFNLDTRMLDDGETWDFFPTIRAFRTEQPPSWTDDIHGGGPQIQPEVKESRIPAALAARIRAWVAASRAVDNEALLLGEAIDVARILPPSVGSRWWKPEPAK